MKLLFYLLALVFVTLPGIIRAQAEEEMEEISVVVTVQQVGGTEMGAVLNGNVIYIPVDDLFQFLQIKSRLSAHNDSVTGFFLTPEMPFLVNYNESRIVVGDKKIDIPKGDLVKTETNLYLNSIYFDQLFGLSCKFNFRSLTINITPAVELPVVREMRLESMRKNINRLKGDIKADTVIKREYPLFSFGMADWSVISTQVVDGPCDNRFNLNLGGTVLGGETEIGLYYSTRKPFTEKEQHYLWRYANNDLKAVRQVLAGKIISYATSSIYSPVVGIQVTNTPTTYRRSFGSYTLSDYTKPGWIVELYVNNVLVDYVKADASGFFTFQVPMVYGSSNVKLKYYGPWGEETIKERNITVPYNFLPQGDLEYTVSGGFVEDSVNSIYSRGNLNYGVTRWMTLGAGVEYLSSVTSGPVMPFMNASLRIGPSFLLGAEYTYGVRFKAVANYRLPSNLQFDAMYVLYDKNQTAINYNILEERKLVVSVPLSGKKISTYARLTLDHIILPQTSSASAELLFSGSFFGVNTNFTTYAMFAELSKPYYYSNLALGFRLPYGILLTPQAQFDYSHGDLISAKVEVEKQFFRRAYGTVSYEQNFRSNITNLQVGFRYDLPSAQTEATYRLTNGISNFIESARGNFIADKKTRTAKFTDRTMVGTGGIVIVPFLDLNNDGQKQDGEPKLSGLNIRINGGMVQEDKRDTVLRILDMEPYTSYLLEADQNSIKNIAWRLRYHTFKVFVDPNRLKLVEVPVMVVGEASGYVNAVAPAGTRGLGRIIINFYTDGGKKAGSVLSESDGYFSWLGLPPGKYFAQVDSAQLQKINMTSDPDRFDFTIEKIIDGDVADDLEFNLKSNVIPPQPKPADTVTPRQPKPGIIPQENLQPREETIIRLGVFRSQSNAANLFKRAESLYPGKATMTMDGGVYKVELHFTGKAESNKGLLKEVRKAGFTDAYILTMPPSKSSGYTP